MTTLCMRLGLVILSGMWIGCMSEQVSASDSQITQSIRPIECIYTTTETGENETVTSTCEDQPVPTLEKVNINDGRPILVGNYDASTALMLRVWINGQWYTLGIDARLTAEGDVWTLDLSGLSVPLQPGIYTIIVEVETTDGLLLRNTNAGAFTITTSTGSDSALVLPPETKKRPGYSSTLLYSSIIPRTDSGVIMPGKINVPQAWSGKDTHGHEKDNIDTEIHWFSIAVAVASSAAVLLVIRRFR